MISAGIDIGSITTKAALIKDGELFAEVLTHTGYSSKEAGQKIFKAILDKTGLKASDIGWTVATGYGRKSASMANSSVTEITCHGAGARFLDPETRYVIDIGGQDSKAIVIDEEGKVTDFVMNDKCAAGTGRFLEVMARALEVDLADFGQMSLKGDEPSSISSLCTVFAESEIISLISKGEKRENIIAGIHESIGSRVMAMAGRIDIKSPVMMTGGVAKNVGVVKAFERRIGNPIKVSEKAQLTGAIGAALIAARKCL